MAGIKEECGVFGIYDLDGGNVVPSIYYGLTSLQHRGQESCGLAVSDTKQEHRSMYVRRIQGLFSACIIPCLPGSIPVQDLQLYLRV